MYPESLQRFGMKAFGFRHRSVKNSVVVFLVSISFPKSRGSTLS